MIRQTFISKMAPHAITCILFIVLISICSATINNGALFSNLTTVPISKEANKGTGFVELATKYGYKSESHVVTTEDGYVLTIHRIPPAAHCTKKVPLLLLPNIHMTSAGFLGIAEQSPGFIYSNECYDVWFGNYRGNSYGRKHVRLSPEEDLDFWKYYVHHNGVYDVPATIDCILGNTGSEQVIIIGYAHGGTIFFIMNSEKPEYASKVSLHVSLAPLARLVNLKSPPVRTLSNVCNIFRDTLHAAGVWEILSKGFTIQGTLATLCQVELLAAIVCGTDTAALDNPHPDSQPPEAQKRIYENFFSGTSVDTFAHFGQLFHTQEFVKFDYGVVKNLKLYGSATPPAYNLKASDVPVVVFKGHNDGLISVEDTDLIVEQLPNVIDYIKVKDPLWNNLDMQYSIYWKDIIFAPMKTYLEQYSKLY
ncbi:lipase 3-like [Choristoneura fumiferana]|uniref:lipase 3-like n=1 Tax=Choristoneura fumiferana TaxID=7141 RepID=UPI003D15ECF7